MKIFSKDLTHQLLVEYSNTGYENTNDRKLIISDLLKLVETTWSKRHGHVTMSCDVVVVLLARRRVYVTLSVKVVEQDYQRMISFRLKLLILDAD